jgi:phage terminase small subunit
MPLNEKQKRFVKEYLVDLNATQAAIRAGYSKKTAGSQGQRLLKNVEIQTAIQASATRRAQRTEITADRVVEELATVAFSRASDSTGAELRYGNKIKALELLCRHLGIFDERNKQTDNPAGDSLLAAISAATSEDIDGDDIPEAE